MQITDGVHGNEEGQRIRVVLRLATARRRAVKGRNLEIAEQALGRGIVEVKVARILARARLETERVGRRAWDAHVEHELGSVSIVGIGHVGHAQYGGRATLALERDGHEVAAPRAAVFERPVVVGLGQGGGQILANLVPRARGRAARAVGLGTGLDHQVARARGLVGNVLGVVLGVVLGILARECGGRRRHLWESWDLDLVELKKEANPNPNKLTGRGLRLARHSLQPATKAARMARWRVRCKQQEYHKALITHRVAIGECVEAICVWRACT